MKKFLLLIILLSSYTIPVFSNDYLFQGSAVFNWDTISQEERDDDIEHIKKNIFSENTVVKIEDFKTKYKDYLKDKNYKTHYLVAAAGYKEYKNYNISAMYLKKLSTLYIYALQPKDNPTVIFYYDTLGNLRYVDNIKGNYPNFPYYTEQYKRNGKLVAVNYFTSKDTQYIFNDEQEFKGVWNQYKFYDLNGKVKMRRSNY